MEFSLGLFAGVAIGVVGTIFCTYTPQNNADKQVDLLNTQAKRNLQRLEQSRKQIAQVSNKAGCAHRELQSQITELAGQE